MPGFLDTYGVADHRRGRLITRIVLSVLAIAAMGSASYLYFRTWSQEQTLKHFFAALDKQDWDVVVADYVMPQFDGLSALAVKPSNCGMT